jgi:hypothetical protein
MQNDAWQSLQTTESQGPVNPSMNSDEVQPPVTEPKTQLPA